MFDDATPIVVPDVRSAAVQGAGPAHLQDVHARQVRTRLAPQEPEAIQRVPAPITHAPTPNPQEIPPVAQVQNIDAAVVLGLDGARRPAQQPAPGWDGENDASAPDWTRPTIW